MYRQIFHNINIDYFSIEHCYHEYEYEDISLHWSVWQLPSGTQDTKRATEVFVNFQRRKVNAIP